MRGEMSGLRFLNVAVALGAFFLSAAPASAQTDQPAVVAVELSGVVDPIVADHIVSVIDRANSSAADAVLLTIDTPGGLSSSMMTSTRRSSTVAYR